MRKVIAIILICTLLMAGCTGRELSEKESIRIAMPASNGMTDGETNYYKMWLEEQSGIDIELELVPPEYMAEYMRLLFSGGAVAVDAVFFNPSETSINVADAEKWGESGHILPLEDMLDKSGENIKAVISEFEAYDLYDTLLSEGGHIYYMPNLQYSDVLKNSQTLWLNTQWLRQVGMALPKTTDEFRNVLHAFSQGDPNGNGQPDELPIAFTTENQSQNIINFLMNAFVYCDSENAYMAVKDGQVFFAPTSEQWRRGLIYCNELYEDGLLPEECFSFSEAQLVRAAADPRDLIGGFSSEAIDDVLLRNAPELFSKYMYVSPLVGPDGTCEATVKSFEPKLGGIITSDCANPEDVFRLMDLMVSQDAYLIAAFGEQGVDWDFAQPNDVSLSGSTATITVKSREWDTPDNKHFSGIGPFVTYQKYSDGVAWNGHQGDQRYLNVRAARAYQEYEPDEYISILQTTGEEDKKKTEVEDFIRDSMIEFIKGERLPGDDVAWSLYLQECDGLGIDSLINAEKQAYGEHRR